MNAQRDKKPGLVLFLGLLAMLGGPVFPSQAEKKSAPEPFSTAIEQTALLGGSMRHPNR